MWPFSSKPDKASLAGLRTVRVNGGTYVIRKVNPLMDFSMENMPQIFSSFQSRRKRPDAPDVSDSAKALRDMYAMVQAGVVEPELVPVGKGDQRGKEEGITVEDLFRDSSTGPQLYWEILAHSLNRYKGLRGAYFLARTRFTLSTAWRRSMDSALAKSASGRES